MPTRNRKFLRKFKERNSLTRRELRKNLRYNRLTGKFYHRRATARKKRNTIAGWTTDQGYVRISVNGTEYPASRLAILYVNGEMPWGAVKHINGIKTDNRYLNLVIYQPNWLKR